MTTRPVFPKSPSTLLPSTIFQMLRRMLLLVFDFFFVLVSFSNGKFAFVDVIGVAKSASDVSTIMSKTTSKELKKREVHLVDSTNTEVEVLSVLTFQFK